MSRGVARQFHISDQLSIVSICAFRITAFIGLIGTVALLGGIVDDFQGFLFLLVNDASFLDKNFFNSSFALLWQANIASLFWFSLAYRKVTKIDYIFLALTSMSIILRFAFVYIVIAAFYFLIPMIASRRIDLKHLLKYGVLLFIVFNYLIFSTYAFDAADNVFAAYAVKVYPYTAGNIVAFLYHFDSFPISLVSLSGAGQIYEALGLSSISSYIDDYFNFNIEIESRMIFIQQVAGQKVYGNTHTIFGQLIYLPSILYFPYLLCFGFLLKKIHLMSRKSVYFLTVHCWFSAASFLAFSGAGHFTTTRFFPAILFIFPLYLFLTIALRPKR
jgi:hypothetical protein